MTDTLADRIFAATYRPESAIYSPWAGVAGQRRTAGELRAAIIRARRYAITPDAACAAAKLGKEHQDILLSLLPRARLPFEHCWVEWDAGEVFAELGTMNYKDVVDGTGALVMRVCEAPLLYCLQGVVVDPTMQRVVINPVAVIYSVDGPLQLQGPSLLRDRTIFSQIIGLSKNTIDRSFIGLNKDTERRALEEEERQYTVEEPDESRHERRSDLAAHASHIMSAFWPPSETLKSPSLDGAKTKSLIMAGLLDSAHVLRMVTSIFALIQARDWTSVSQPERNAARRRFVGAKTVPYLQHIRVKLELPRAVIMRQASKQATESIPKARHEVEGHWAHRHGRGDPECGHVFVSKMAVSECTLCGWQRWWRKEHMRGDATIGFIEKTRVVTRRAA